MPLPVPALMNRGVCVSCTLKWGPIPTLYGVRSSSFAKLINMEIKLLACQKPAKEIERAGGRKGEREKDRTALRLPQLILAQSER